MSGKDKRPLVPRLRFPEFREAGEWSFKPLGELAKRSTRKNTECGITRVLTNSAEHGVVDQRDFFDKDIADQGNLEGYYIVEKGAYVYNPRISKTAPVGPVSKNNLGTGVMSPLYTVFMFNSSQNDFYAHYFKSTHWHRYVCQSSSTGARHDRMSITNDAFMGLPLPVSTPEEQEKIANCLSSLDELIEAETQKLDALKTHKKGMMQQLFPRKGEAVPRMRFPEFREAGGWKPKAIREVFRVTRGDVLAMPRIKDVPSEDYPYPVYSSQTKNRGLAGYFSDYLFEDAITWTTDGANAGEVNYRRGKFFCTNVCGVLLNLKGWANPFVAEILNSTTRKYVSYVGNPKLMNGAMSEIVIPFPSLPEQEKISAYLSLINELITTQTQKLESLKIHKKGLMQQLFPAFDEVSA